MRHGAGPRPVSSQLRLVFGTGLADWSFSEASAGLGQMGQKTSDRCFASFSERVLFMMIRAAAFTTARVAFALATAREWLAQEGVM